MLAYILSLPRSGSTVLSAMLDRLHGIVSPPESSFPQVLGILPKSEREDKRWLAALYHGATFPPTPLSFEDSLACMHGSDEEILESLGRAVAAKLGRSSEDVRMVIWKTPRTIGLHRGPLATSGKFIVLRRNPHNVFESQFRVSFGENNRNPYRFAIFRESYEHAFARLPEDRVFQIHYDQLPEVIPGLLDFLGVPDQGHWQAGGSSLDLAAAACSWMSDVTREFRNEDPRKRERLDPRQVRKLDRALSVALPFRPFLGPVRSHFDLRSVADIRARATEVLKAAKGHS